MLIREGGIEKKEDGEERKKKNQTSFSELRSMKVIYQNELGKGKTGRERRKTKATTTELEEGGKLRKSPPPLQKQIYFPTVTWSRERKKRDR